MAHVASIGLFPPSWYPRTVNGVEIQRTLRKVSEIPSGLASRGFSFTPREFAHLYWNCRRLLVTSTFQWKLYNSGGSAYSVASPITQTYRVPLLKTGTTPREIEFQKYQERLLVKGTDAVTGSNVSWDPSTLRVYDHGVIGSPQGFYERSRVNFSILGDYAAYHVDPVLSTTTTRILWPSRSCLFTIFGQRSSNFTIDFPTDGTACEQRGLFHFLDFPPVPLYLLTQGNPTSYFQFNQSVADIRVTWPQTTPEDRDIYNWPYADRTDGRYQDGLDPAPDEFGNW